MGNAPYTSFRGGHHRGAYRRDVINRMASMDGMAGDDTSLADEIARLIVESVAPAEPSWELQHKLEELSADARCLRASSPIDLS